MSIQYDPSFAFQERAREVSRFAINGIRIAMFLGGLAADGSSRWLGIVFGAISVIAGIVVLSVPIQAIGTLAIVAGVFLVVARVSQLARALRFGRGAAANF